MQTDNTTTSSPLLYRESVARKRREAELRTQHLIERYTKIKTSPRTSRSSLAVSTRTEEGDDDTKIGLSSSSSVEAEDMALALKMQGEEWGKKNTAPFVEGARRRGGSRRSDSAPRFGGASSCEGGRRSGGDSDNSAPRFRDVSIPRGGRTASRIMTTGDGPFGRIRHPRGDTSALYPRTARNLTRTTRTTTSSAPLAVEGTRSPRVQIGDDHTETLSNEGWHFIPAKEGAACRRGSSILTLPNVLFENDDDDDDDGGGGGGGGAFVMFMNARSSDASRPRLWFKSLDGRAYEVWCATERPFRDMPRGFQRAYRTSSEDVVLTSDSQLYVLNKRKEPLRSGRVAHFPSAHCNILVFVKPVAASSYSPTSESRPSQTEMSSTRRQERSSILLTRSRSRERGDRLSNRMSALLPPSASVSASTLDPFRPPTTRNFLARGTSTRRGAPDQETVDDFIARHRRIREAAERRLWDR